ncbi:MAG: globin [Acidimicrobiia bacterium]|nr:globin [Acidimicrobiia bacterium]
MVSADPTNAEPATLHELVGGRPFFERLVDSFYEGVAADDVLLRLYPEAPDLTGARHRLTGFLVQYWGGPTTYSQERGHPRLRMRHLPFTIGPVERDHWLLHMRAAVAAATAELDQPLASVVADALLRHFEPTAEQMRNDTGLPISSARPQPA